MPLGRVPLAAHDDDVPGAPELHEPVQALLRDLVAEAAQVFRPGVGFAQPLAECWHRKVRLPPGEWKGPHVHQHGDVKLVHEPLHSVQRRPARPGKG